MKKTLLARFNFCIILIISCVYPQLVAAQDLKTQNINLSGYVSYLQKITLPQHAYLIVQLIDIHNANGPFPIVAETAFEPMTAMPIDFNLLIDEKQIDKDKAYALQAKIVVGDILWFVSEKRIPVNLNAAGVNYQLNLVPLNQNSNNQDNAPTTIIGQEWLVEDIFGQGIIDYSRMTIDIDEKSEPSDELDIKKYHVNGSTGCNRYNTNILISERKQTIDFTPPIMTFMVCAEAITQQEGRFIEMLGKSNSYIFDDVGRLILKDEQGNYIGRLVPNM